MLDGTGYSLSERLGLYHMHADLLYLVCTPR